MDGIAIAFDAWEKGHRTFPIEGTQAAGEPKKTLSGTGNAIEVMTGAMLPAGTDTVVRYEDLKVDGQQATLTVENLVRGQSVHRQGQDATRDEVLLAAAGRAGVPASARGVQPQLTEGTKCAQRGLCSVSVGYLVTAKWVYLGAYFPKKTPNMAE